MVGLGPVEGAGRHDFGHDGAGEAARGCQPLFRGRGGGFLFRPVEKDGRAVLGSDIGALSIQGRRIVDLPEQLEKFRIRNSGRVEGAGTKWKSSRRCDRQMGNILPRIQALVAVSLDSLGCSCAELGRVSSVSRTVWRS